MLEKVLNAFDSLDERVGIYRAKRVEFEIDGIPAALVREWWTGRLALQVGGETVELQNRFTGMFPFVTHMRWSRRVHDHDVVVEAKLPFLVAAVRRTMYRVYLDGLLVKEASLRF